MKIGYSGARPYSKRGDKKLNQKALLNDCDCIVIEKTSWLCSELISLDKVINELNPNDELVVCSLSFLAINLEMLFSKIKAIENKKANLIVINMEDDLLGHFTALKEFQSYIASANIKRGQGETQRKTTKKIGRKLLLTDSEKDRILKLWESGNFTVTELAKNRNLSRKSIYRVINKKEEKK
jgi:DNA invertase Pin-like site-specific DNA recombinase